LKAFLDKAKKNPDKNYLQIQSFSCHGYSIMGLQAVATPYYDPLTKNYEIIPVESLVRLFTHDVPNTYCLVFFACNRDIK
jgi:hypothetical protein